MDGFPICNVGGLMGLSRGIPSFSLSDFMYSDTILNYSGEKKRDRGQESRDHFVYATSQWETALQCNAVFHWLGAYNSVFWLIWKGHRGTLECTAYKGGGMMLLIYIPRRLPARNIGSDHNQVHIETDNCHDANFDVIGGIGEWR